MTYPVLRTDLLPFFHLCVDVRNRRLIDNTTTLMFNGVDSYSDSLLIRALFPKADFQDILDECSAITRPCSLAAPVQHDAYHRIETMISRFSAISSTL